MSMGQIIVLIAIIGAFVVFAAVLAWGDYHGRSLARRIRERDRRDAALAATATVGKEGEKAAAAQAQWPKVSDDRMKHVA